MRSHSSLLVITRDIKPDTASIRKVDTRSQQANANT